MRWFLATLLLVLAPISLGLWMVLSCGIDTNLRGVSTIAGHDSSASDSMIVWASGSNGVVLRWIGFPSQLSRVHVPDGDALDFRGIRAVSEKTAYLMSSGEGDKSRIYKTTDSGATWKLQYTDKRPAFFLDALVCASPTECFALGDPIDGKFVLLHTQDGENWNSASQAALPPALPGEGAFAASNTSLAICGSDIYFGTGGGRAARVFHSHDLGQKWTVADTPMAIGNASSGIFSVACSGDKVAVVGGDYKDPARANGVAAYSSNRGKSWHLAAGQPGGYRSSVVWTGGANLLAVGPNGEDLSKDFGAHWMNGGSFDLNAVFYTQQNRAWAVGAKGNVARLDMSQ